MSKFLSRILAITAILLITLQAFPVAAATASENPFAIKYEDVYHFSIYRHYKKLYAEFDDMAFIKAVNALPILKKAEKFSEDPLIAAYSTYCGADRTHIYQIRPYELKCDDTAYVLTQQQYDTLKKAIERTSPDEHSVYYPIWLGYINSKRVTGISFTGTDGIIRNVLDDNLTMAAQQHMLLTVSPKNVTSYLKKDINVNNLKNACKTVIRFDNKSYYIIVMQENKLYIESSGRDYGYIYEDAYDKSENATTWKRYKRMMSVFVREQVNPLT